MPLDTTQEPPQKVTARSATGNLEANPPINGGPTGEHLALLACVLSASKGLTLTPEQAVRKAIAIWQEAKKAAPHPEHYLSGQVGKIKLGLDGTPIDNDCYFFVKESASFSDLVSRRAVPDSRKGGAITSVQGIRKAVRRFYEALDKETAAPAKTKQSRSKSSSPDEMNVREEADMALKTKTISYKRWIELCEFQNKELSKKPPAVDTWVNSLTPKQKQRLDERSCDPNSWILTEPFVRNLTL